MPKGEAQVRAKRARMLKVAQFRLDTGASWPETFDEAKLPPDTRKRWPHDPVWQEIRADIDAKVDILAANKATRLFPGFLEWRERFCAYEDHRTKKIVRAQTNFYQQDSYAHLQEHNRLLIVLPPGHIKTTMFAIEHSVWAIMRDRNIRIVIVQKNANEAEKIVLEVANRLSNHDYYHELARRLEVQGDKPIECPLCVYGDDFRPDVRKAGGGKWSAEGFKVQGVTSGEKDLTFEAKGVGGQIQGMRADIIILDDVQDPEMAVRSLKDSDDKMGWFQRVILGRVTEAQKVIVLANYFSDDDFAHKVETLFVDELGVPAVTYPAILDEDKRKVLCPEFWSWTALQQKRKEVGARTWYYTWMQEAGSFEDRTFRREVLEGSRDPEFYVGSVPAAVTDIFVGVDPAVANSGHCAMVVWGLDRRTKRRFLIDVFNQAGMRTWDNVSRQIVKFCAQYSPRVCVIESNNVQGSLALNPSLVRDLRSLGVKVQTYQTVTGTGARAEITNFDITTIGGLFEANLVVLPYGGDSSQVQKIDDYIDQLVKWRTDENGNSVKNLKRDMVMATLFAESEAFEAARRENQTKKPKRRDVPRWGLAEDGGYAWARPGSRKRAELQTLP